jgi:hypothetical protein
MSYSEYFSKRTLRLLKRSGWYPGRSVPTDAFESLIASEGYYLNDTIRNFLQEFGGIVIHPPHIIRDNGTIKVSDSEPLFIAPLDLSFLPFPEHVYLCEDILHGETLIPIGVWYLANIFMSYSGQLYVETDFEFFIMSGTPYEAIEKICTNSKDENGNENAKLHEKIAYIGDDEIEFYGETKLNKNLQYILDRSPNSLIPFDTRVASNTNRRLYGLEMQFVCKTYTFDSSAERIVNFLKELTLLYPDWLPFYFTSAKSGKHRLISHSTVPSLHEMKEIIIDTTWHSCSETGQITCCNIGPNHENIGKMLEVHFQVCVGDNCNRSWVRFPPYYEDTKLITSKEFIKNVFGLFLKHWQPTMGLLLPSYPLIRRCVNNIMLVEGVGCFSYFSKEFGLLPKLPDWAKITSLDEGNYIQIADELPNYKNLTEFTNFVERLRELADIIYKWLPPAYKGAQDTNT